MIRDKDFPAFTEVGCICGLCWFMFFTSHEAQIQVMDHCSNQSIILPVVKLTKSNIKCNVFWLGVSAFLIVYIAVDHTSAPG